MRRTIYVGSAQSRTSNPRTNPSVAQAPRSPSDSSPAGGSRRSRGRFRSFVRRYRSLALLVAGFGLAFVASFLYDLLTPDQAQITPEQIGATIEESLDEFASQPATTALAYAAVAPSVVRVRRLGADPTDDTELGVGTGVVLQESGEILTNLHVVAGAERINVLFANGFETEAMIAGAQPENDLAVLSPAVIPEGLPAATMGSSASLRPGDQVVAVGHPFGIGPSASAGVISGLGRNYATLDGSVILDNLIQFDAAANPGNSGGPLVNRRGEVVGIVTSILNPTEDSVFVGIGFAVPIETAANAAGPNPF